ncbi:SURF1 family cytochrome oxidase biogenesis protein [Sphingomonas mesophila]|uniref:SURF1 family cytochrome oxidase biogenesis protein n=1 Tax=Sphingomonas mesophila TaxID=2303576 RepID=UPI000E593753|nr:SURF1 family cytochrome oxidase biogenesis protein [Sphingomonas mesophila]
MRRWPLVPTLVVAVAVSTMIGLGLWQLLWRAPQKDALVASYAAAQGLSPIAFPTAPAPEPLPLFRRATGLCTEVTGWRQVAGENRRGAIGYAFLADCRTGAEGPGITVDAGWAANPQIKPDWRGGPVSGVISPDRVRRVRLVSESGLGGLEPSAAPSPAMIRNSHRSYAFQWFAFALIAAVIYGLALRARRDKEANR